MIRKGQLDSQLTKTEITNAADASRWTDGSRCLQMLAGISMCTVG